MGVVPSLNVHVLGQFDTVAQTHESGRYKVAKSSLTDGTLSKVKLQDNSACTEHPVSTEKSHGCASKSETGQARYPGPVNC